MLSLGQCECEMTSSGLIFVVIPYLLVIVGAIGFS